MELHESSLREAHELHVYKQSLYHFERKENLRACAILKRNPVLLKLVDSDGCTLLHQAVKHANVYMAMCLIESGIDVNVQDRRGRTALMTVESQPDEVTLTEILLEAHAHLHLRDDAGESGLQMILKKGYREVNFAKLCVRNLIAHYSQDLDKIARLFLECKNPLLHLFWAKNPMLTRSLLHQGYPVNTKIGPIGETALHLAVGRNDLGHVKILVDCGASVHATDVTGATPLISFDARHRGSTRMLEIIKILLDRGASMTTFIMHSELMPAGSILRYGGREELQLLLHYGFDLRARDGYDQTPLHLLALNDCENILHELQGMDFDVHAKEEDGRTPLHYAVSVRNSSSVKFLLDNGADVNALAEHNYTPLHLAFMPDDEYKGRFDVRSVEILLEYGANPQAVSSLGSSVLDVIVDMKEFVAIKPVLAHLAILRARGVAVRKGVIRDIWCHDRLDRCFNFYERKIKRMKTVGIWESLTLYDLLMLPEDKLAVYVRNGQLVLKLARLSVRYKRRSNYFYELIRRRVEKAVAKARVKERAAVVICKLMNLHLGAVHIVSDGVVKYLDYKDLLSLLQL